MEELHSLPWNLQAMQAPSHLLTDVTEAVVGGHGRRREEGPLHQGKYFAWDAPFHEKSERWEHI